MSRIRMFHVSFKVPHTMLSTVMEVINSEAFDLAVSEIANGATIHSLPRERSKTVPDRGRIKELANNLQREFKGQVLTREQFRAQVERVGLKPTSDSPSATLLSRGQHPILARLEGRGAGYRVA